MNHKAPKRGLGRGLGALIPTAPPEDEQEEGREAGHEPVGRGAPHGVIPAGWADETPGAVVGRPASEVPAQRGDEVGDPRSAGRPPDQAGGARAVNGDSPAGSDGFAGNHHDAAPPNAYFAEVPLDQVVPNPRQPRQVFEEEAMAELVHSVREAGLLQPIVVRPVGPEAYELVMGERRWRACQEAGQQLIPAIVRSTDDDDMLRDALLENLHRTQLNPLEEAAAYGQMLEDFDCTHDELAQRIGRSRPQISNTLRLLRLSPTVQRRVAAGVLSAGHARALLGVEDPERQDALAQRVVSEGISVRGLAELVAVGDGNGTAEKAQRRAHPTAPGLDELSGRLSERLETRVKVDLGRRKGKITVEYASLEDLRRIVDIIDPGSGDERPI